MKNLLYVFCLVVATIGLNACKKDDPAPISPIVGRWELNRGLLNGFPTGSNLNGRSIDLYYIENYKGTIDIFSDNTFNANIISTTVDDYPGSWEFSNNNLTLNYDDGEEQTYTYSSAKNIEELTSSTPVSYTLPVSTTAVAVGTLTPVYRK